jgi:hypothetical protein
MGRHIARHLAPALAFVSAGEPPARCVGCRVVVSSHCPVHVCGLTLYLRVTFPLAVLTIVRKTRVTPTADGGGQIT